MVDAKTEQWSTKGVSLLMLSHGYATVQLRVYHIFSYESYSTLETDNDIAYKLVVIHH